MRPARDSVGGLIRRRRVESGMTQQELARRADLSVRALRDIESGRARPRALSAQRLAAALALSDSDRDALVSNGHPDGDEGGLRLDILGPMSVRLDTVEVHGLSPARRDVLALLALHANETVTVDEIVDTLWGERPPRTCRNVVHVHIARLRSTLTAAPVGGSVAEALVSAGRGYALRIDPRRIDAGRFGDLVTRAEGEATGSIEEYRTLDEALGQWRGRVVTDASDRLQQHPTAVALTNRRLAAALALAETAAALRLPEQPIALLRRLIHDEPLHEGLHVRLMLALALDGQRSTALREFARLRRRLREELGIEPGPEARQAHLTILHADQGDRAGADSEGGQIRSAFPIPAQLPPAVSGFTGRTEALEHLDELLPAAEGSLATVVISAIAGTGGVGKTALAVHWAHRARDQFPDGQLYVNLRGFGPSESPITPADAVRGFLDALGVAPHRIPTDVTAQVGLYRSLLAGRRMLVVLDNARDAEQVRPLLPASPGCFAVVTSRNPLTSLLVVEGAYPIILNLMTVAEAREMLGHRLGRHRVAAEPGEIDNLVALCARLPLALAITAARIAARPAVTIKAMTSELQETGSTLDGLDGGDPITNVRAVFSWSYHTLSPDAGRLFRLLGLHPGPDVSVAAAASLAGIPIDRARRLLDELNKAHVLAENAPGRFAFHDLLRAYAAELAHDKDDHDDRRQALRRLFDHYLHTALAADQLLYPNREEPQPAAPQHGVTVESLTDAQQASTWFASEHPVLIASVRQAAMSGFVTHTWQLTWALATYLERQGHWHDWINISHTALEITHEHGCRLGQAYSEQSLGYGYTRLHRLDDATSHLQRSLDLFNAVGTPILQGLTLLNLGIVAGRQGKYAEALRHDEQALQRYRIADHRQGLAATLNNIGWHYCQLGDYAKGLIYSQDALALHHELGNRPGAAAAWDTLGHAHHHLGDLQQSTASYQKALDLFVELGDQYHHGEVLLHLGDNHAALNELDAARHAWSQAQALLKELDHPDAEEAVARLEGR
ncbi:BTAD domain-containing putative transcriptional regulator [Nonomuraea sp. NPDC050153]|uniref:BTAD domain-containing putative transcriptional regulator n=1 Tax=Nonomuraea sp. NPDC050153 TaxID=3364359 RepID=UPI00379DF8CB